jgi:hypothetical protein
MLSPQLEEPRVIFGRAMKGFRQLLIRNIPHCKAGLHTP